MTTTPSPAWIAKASCAALLGQALLAPTATASAPWVGALTDGDVKLHLRYRFESVDQDGIDKDASASTLKTRITYTTAPWQGFQGKLEFDDVTALGGEAYNSTANGKGQYPVVADPAGTEVNQAWIRYSQEPFSVTAGRQRILLDNQRFVGGVGWRQNEQTYDGLSATFNPVENLDLFYAYVHNVNRIFGPENMLEAPDFGGDIHLLNAAYDCDWLGRVSGYAYLLDFEDAAALSSATYGVRLDGKYKTGEHSLLYTAEYAMQSDHGDNPASYDADYYHLVGGLALPQATFKVGYEVLGSDDGVSFKTPLATGHAFQGFSDKFLLTPPDGIEDLYVSASTTVQGTKLTATYHDFSAETGGEDYGSEIDIVVARKFCDHYTAMLKYAKYSSDDYATDTDKLWLSVAATF